MDPSTTIQIEMSQLVRVSWIMLIPVALLLMGVLYKLAYLLHGVSEFLTMARYELYPTLKEIRKTAGHVELISAKASVGVENVEKGLGATADSVKSIKAASEGAMGRFGPALGSFFKSLLSGK